MKKYLLVLLIYFSNYQYLFAQAPQGINYQAIALDVSGNSVANQSIKLRLSILDGSATGTIVYEETHSTTTDNTGLFSLVIGNGTVSSGTFNSINWGNGTKWLKTEIDITGGTNYSLMGSSQFMSTPYALYANKTSFTAPSFSLPDGFDKITPILIMDSTNYIVPAGKNLYLPSLTPSVKIDNNLISTGFGSIGADAKNFGGASEGSVIWLNQDEVCFLTDKTVDWTTVDIVKNAFTVPGGKQFVIVNYFGFLGTSGNEHCICTINGTPTSINNLTNFILEEGTVISTTGTCAANAIAVLNGYFKDK